MKRACKVNRLPKNYNRCSSCSPHPERNVSLETFAKLVSLKPKFLRYVCKAIGYEIPDPWPTRDDCLFCHSYGPNKALIRAAQERFGRMLTEHLHKKDDS